MRSKLFFLILAISMGSNAQSIEEIQKEIDIQVWRPFKNAFETLNGEALNATYAEQVLRATPDGLDTENAFKPKNLERFQKNRKEGLSIALDFWFDSRRTNSNTSYEVGFYRIGFTDKLGKTNFVYGHFHIVLKKVEGQWKITQDWDTTTINGKAIGADDFAAQEPLEF
ncbi:nuclear transport factor 2 family protein [Croceivirga thetidis]|uniref:Nuclear transport factor 2 family protein n=1 Tax=Croceivirga thetidis TaxID=2721623 RepID=A0ABX1GPE2_9FLAO|nr:nuclear transport factor 2 family protein [Croceivirga thetidis]NKI30956.1 nuclear transport factor 2 family protein [Croceivirga thetidis]